MLPKSIFVVVFPPHAGDQPHSRQPLNQLCPPTHINLNTRLVTPHALATISTDGDGYNFLFWVKKLPSKNQMPIHI